MTTQVRDQVLDGRADLYRWFSAVFAKEQDATSWQFHTSPEFRELLEERAAQFAIEAEADVLAGYLDAERDAAVENTVMTLAVDYARLFIGPGPGLAPPFESLYTSPDGRLYADAYADVIDTLYRAGIGVATEFKAPADHAAVELAVVAHMLDGGAPAAEGAPEGPADADAFLQAHVVNWFPRWCADIVEHAESDFYRGAARMLAAFVTHEQARLGTPAEA